MAGRVLLIGLDSADADLIERWSEAGHLPTLRALRTQGAWARLATTSNVLHVSAWPTLHTGTRPGAHGMYHAYQIRAGEQEVHRTAASETGVAPFWKFLDEGGARCIVLDAFMTAPVAGFRGIQVLEYGTWTWFDQPRATPDGTWKEVLRRFGPYPAPEHTKVHGQPEPRRFRDQLLAGAEVKGRLGKWLLEERPWDFAYLNFAEPHPAGHYLWHVQDPSYPTYPPGGIEGLGEALLDVYRAVDAGIARVLEAVDDEDTVIVTSGDGMGPNFSGCHLVPEALHRLDLYHAADVGAADVGKSQASSEARPRQSLLSSLRGLVPPELRRAVSRCLPPMVQHRLSMKWANADIDWERTRAFCIPNANEAFVRINLDGREPRGKVAKGEEYLELVARLKLRLGELVNPDTGVIGPEDVIHVEDVFQGPRRGDLPDVIVTWNPAARVLARLESEACGRISLRAGHETAPYYTGNHRPSAFALARGPGVAAGAQLAGAHVVDVAPTVAALLGREPAPHLEGRVLEELLGSGARGA
jgi:predicted AlkP superfamily phosphohydrolase/phosphomutase